MENIVKFLLFVAAIFLIFVIVKAVTKPVVSNQVMVGRTDQFGQYDSRDQTWLNGVPMFAY
jgi:hypothetical protein